jgi:hypothetical protein
LALNLCKQQACLVLHRLKSLSDFHHFTLNHMDLLLSVHCSEISSFFLQLTGPSAVPVVYLHVALLLGVATPMSVILDSL